MGRFFNHSCEPNMRPIKVMINAGSSSESSGCPTMGFFAIRNILAGEELTWKYVSGNEKISKIIGFKCQCGSPYCCSLSK